MTTELENLRSIDKLNWNSDFCDKKFGEFERGKLERKYGGQRVEEVFFTLHDTKRNKLVDEIRNKLKLKTR
jgi:hypothetical protein